MQMPGRKFSATDSYRYGFNGKENDVKGEGNSLDFGARIYDPRIGRWLSTDPLQVKYPELTPYHFTANNPINFIDPDGRDTVRFTSTTVGMAERSSGLDEVRIPGSFRTTYSITVIQAPGEDKFFYDTKSTVMQANGNPITGSTSREFFPNDISSSKGITSSPRTYLLGSRDDKDFVSLAKLASPELLAYLKVHDRMKYGGLGMVQDAYAEYEQASNYAGTILMAAGVGGLLKAPGAITAEANFAQKTFSSKFSEAGAFAGRSVDDVALSIKHGSLSTSSVPVQYIMRNGQQLILNTRSAAALTKAGVPRSMWTGVNMTGNATAEARLTEQLGRNKLTGAGTATTRQAGTSTSIKNNGVSQ